MAAVLVAVAVLGAVAFSARNKSQDDVVRLSSVSLPPSDNSVARFQPRVRQVFNHERAPLLARDRVQFRNIKAATGTSFEQFDGLARPIDRFE